MVPAPVGLSKLSDAAKSNDVKKTDYEELQKNINTIATANTNDLVEKGCQQHKQWKWIKSYWLYS